MSLDTQTFGLTRYWLAVALDQVPRDPQIFAKKNLGLARKSFLAGSRQLAAIKNWLTCAQIIESGKGSVTLTDLGRLMAARDKRAEMAWTWWLLHLHLCVNADAFPYSTFFAKFDSEGAHWLTTGDIVKALVEETQGTQNQVGAETIETYFAGVERTFHPGSHVHDLRLVERRSADTDRTQNRLRRCVSNPADIAVAYATVLFQKWHFSNQNTVEARLLLEKGLAKALGLREIGLRDVLKRISQHQELSQFVQYRRVVNLDSVQFPKMGEPALRALRQQAYVNGDVKWP